MSITPILDEMAIFQDALYEQTLDYLYGLQHIGIKLGLQNIEALLKLLGNPQRGFNSIHIAGSNAKGSTAAFMAAILQAAGYKVGLYTSPHLIDFSERIRINADPISPEEVIMLTSIIRELIDRNPDFAPPAGAHPTFFEFTTALAFSYFAGQKVDIAIVETGMGGRLDATNVLNPWLSVITGISLEHQQYLGHSLAEIAGEKAGIIKPGAKVFSGVKEPEAIAVIERECQSRNATLDCLKPACNWQLRAGNLKQQRFDLQTSQTVYADLQIKLLGDFQLRNAAVAVGALETLAERELVIPESAIREGLASTRWPGRLQLIAEHPAILLDGAHNPQASRALAANLPKLMDYNKLILVLGVLLDKDIAGIIAAWLDIADVFVLTRVDSDRAADPAALARFIPADSHKQIVLKSSIAQAINYARRLAGPDDLILITGSLYTVGEALSILQGQFIRRKSNQ